LDNDNTTNGRVGVYDATTGATINTSLISGLGGPSGIAVSGGYIYVSRFNEGLVGKYDAVTGATVNATFISGLNHPFGIAVSGSDLYVSNFYDNKIGLYNAITGAAINASLITGVSALGIAVVAIPEPSTYAMLAGLAGLIVAIGRRRSAGFGFAPARTIGHQGKDSSK